MTIAVFSIGMLAGVVLMSCIAINRNEDPENDEIAKKIKEGRK